MKQGKEKGMPLHKSDLILNVKEIYYRQIESGDKDHEYRECKPYWDRRLEDPNYPGIQIRLGYPKNDDDSRIQKFVWCGFFKTKLNLMGEGRKWVYAFPLSKLKISGKLLLNKSETRKGKYEYN